MAIGPVSLPGLSDSNPLRQNTAIRQLSERLEDYAPLESPTFTGNVTIPFTQTGTGAVARRVDAKLKEVVSVKDFGAVGDGSSHVLSTRYDSLAAAQVVYPFATALTQEIDYCAIQAAINAVGAYSLGGGVYFPPGVYLVSSTLNVTTDGVMLYGLTKQSVQIRRASNYGPTIKFSTNSATRVFGGGLRSLTLYDSNSSMTVASSVAHIVMDYTDGVTLTDISILEGCGLVRLLSANNVIIDRFVGAVYNGSPSQKAAITIGQTSIGGATGLIPSITWMSNVDLLLGVGIAASTCMDYGIYVDSCDGLWVDDFHVYDTAVANIYIGNSSSRQISNIYMNGMLLDHCGGYGMLLQGTTSVQTLEFSGRVSSLGAGGGAYHGIAVTSPCQDMKLTASVEGFNASGIYVSNANANDINISPGIIRNNDADNAATAGGGILIDQATRVTISGGNVGGDGKQDFGIRVGSGVNRITISGVTICDNQGAGIEIVAGADNIMIGSCNLSNNLVAISDASVGNTKLILNCLGIPIALTGVPTAPTAAPGTNTTQIATTAFVQAAGKVVNRYYTSFTTWTTITTAIPLDNTIPQNTEGVQVLSLSATTTTSTQVLRVAMTIPVYGNNTTSAAIYQGSTCIYAVATSTVTASAVLPGIVEYSPGAAGSYTISVRVGPQAAGTSYVNGLSGGGLFGGICACTLVVEVLEP